MSRVADKIPGDATVSSRERRLMRFLSNPAMRVREWYEGIARALLKNVAQTVEEIRLILDGLGINF